MVVEEEEGRKDVNRVVESRASLLTHVHLANFLPIYRLVQKRGTVLLSTSLTWPAAAGSSRAETCYQLSSISFAQPCIYQGDHFLVPVSGDYLDNRFLQSAIFSYVAPCQVTGGISEKGVTSPLYRLEVTVANG